MRFLCRYPATALLAWTLSLTLGQMAHAHLMVAQHGTLNFLDDKVFMVLSLPISAFDGVDDDSNGRVSMIEFNNHRRAIVDSIEENVLLSDGQKSVSLEGVMLSPVVAHGPKTDGVSQLTVMGRFALSNAQASNLRFHVGLYGLREAEKTLEITATRKYDNQKSLVELSPAKPEGVIFPDTKSSQ